MLKFGLRGFVVLAITSMVTLAACSSEPEVQTQDTPTPAPTIEVEPTTPPPESPDVVEFAPIDDGMLGMHVAGIHQGLFPSQRVPVESVRLWDSGTSWAQIEINRGRYDWSGLDRSLATANAAGVSDILMVLGPTPTWNARTTEGVHYPLPGAAAVPRSLTAWDAFVRATVDRYAGRITAYQIWNEASLRMFWRGSPETLADMTKRAYDIIKEGDPDALVVAGSSTVRLPAAYERFFLRYMRALAALDWPIDVIAIHSYPTGEQDPQDRANNLRIVRTSLDELNAPDLPVWDTELNYGLAGPGPIARTAITGERAIEWTVRTYLDSLKFDVSRTYWYIWTEQPYDLLGIQMTNRSAAVTGLQTVEAWLAGGEWGGCTTVDNLNRCYLRKNGETSEVLWTDVGNASVSDVPGGANICDVRNECTPATSAVLTVTTSPVRITP